MVSAASAPAAIAMQTKEGIAIAVEKRVSSKLLAPPKSSEKLYIIDDHVMAAVAGQTADANILINYARLAAQRHRYTYGEDMPVEQLVQSLCDTKHSYTQYGGLRPFGVAFLYAGWDRHHGYQLYQSDPSGTYR
jgi:20S proteasome subunit alpha 3